MIIYGLNGFLQKWQRLAYGDKRLRLINLRVRSLMTEAGSFGREHS